MRACAAESGMELPEGDVRALADVLYREAGGGAGTAAEEVPMPFKGVGVNQLRDVFAAHPGLIENLTFR